MYKVIEDIISKYNFDQHKWIKAKVISVAQWVRVKCEFGCEDYGLGACPPNTPSVSDCERFFREYNHALLIRVSTNADKDNYPSDWSRQTTKTLLELEKDVFLAGYQKAFLLNQTCCCTCKACPGNRLDCTEKRNSRPSPEAFAVDVYQLVQKKQHGSKRNIRKQIANEPVCYFAS